MNAKEMIRESIGVAITVAKYGLAEHMAEQVHNAEPIATTMGAFVVADILDGACLRPFAMDTPIRRVTDGVVDHVSVARVAGEIAKSNSSARPYIGVLAARAIAVGALNTVHFMRTGEVTKGQWNQKTTNIASALFGIAAASHNKKLTHSSGLVAAGIAIATAPAHLKGLGEHHSGKIRTL